MKLYPPITLTILSYRKKEATGWAQGLLRFCPDSVSVYFLFSFEQVTFPNSLPVAWPVKWSLSLSPCLPECCRIPWDYESLKVLCKRSHAGRLLPPPLWAGERQGSPQVVPALGSGWWGSDSWGWAFPFATCSPQSSNLSDYSWKMTMSTSRPTCFLISIFWTSLHFVCFYLPLVDCSSLG